MPSGGIVSLRRVAMGVESTHGTAVPTTKIMLAEAELDVDVELFRNEHPLGVMIEQAGPTKIKREDAGLRIRAEGVSYEDLPWYLGMGVDKPVTAGAGPYTHTFDPGDAAIWAPDSQTIELRYTDGTVDEDVEIEYCMARQLTLSGEQNGELSIEADIFGRRTTDAANTSLSFLQGEPVVISDGKIYINESHADADADVPSGGQFTAQIISFNLEIMTGLFPFHGIDGNTYFVEHKEAAKTARLRLRCLYDTGASDTPLVERAKAAARTVRFVTISFTGTGNLKARFVLTCQHEKGGFLQMGDQDGLDVIEMNLIGWYDSTAAKMFSSVITNDNDVTAYK